MEKQKTPIEVKGELVGLLGTNKEKLSFCSNPSNASGFISILNKLNQDLTYCDASGVSNYEVIKAMTLHRNCPKDVILFCLKNKILKKEPLLYRSEHIPIGILEKESLRIISIALENIETSLNNFFEDILSSDDYSMLCFIALNPKTNPNIRREIERISDYTSGTLLENCLLKTNNEAWLSQHFGALDNQEPYVLRSIALNPLAKPHMIHEVCKGSLPNSFVAKIIKHQNINPVTLEMLADKFPKMRNYILQQSSDEDDLP